MNLKVTDLNVALPPIHCLHCTGIPVDGLRCASHSKMAAALSSAPESWWCTRCGVTTGGMICDHCGWLWTSQKCTTPEPCRLCPSPSVRDGLCESHAEEDERIRAAKFRESSTFREIVRPDGGADFVLTLDKPLPLAEPLSEFERLTGFKDLASAWAAEASMSTPSVTGIEPADYVTSKDECEQLAASRRDAFRENAAPLIAKELLETDFPLEDLGFYFGMPRDSAASAADQCETWSRFGLDRLRKELEELPRCGPEFVRLPSGRIVQVGAVALVEPHTAPSPELIAEMEKANKALCRVGVAQIPIRTDKSGGDLYMTGFQGRVNLDAADYDALCEALGV